MLQRADRPEPICPSQSRSSEIFLSSVFLFLYLYLGCERKKSIQANQAGLTGPGKQSWITGFRFLLGFFVILWQQDDRSPPSYGLKDYAFGSALSLSSLWGSIVRQSRHAMADLLEKMLANKQARVRGAIGVCGTEGHFLTYSSLSSSEGKRDRSTSRLAARGRPGRAPLRRLPI